ncbi:hypothetical protein JHK85_018908 [Glycine max]|nr:hypothetical protein JHK85_018908 [Glycine max]
MKPNQVLDPEVAVKKEKYQVFEELVRGQFGTVFHCFQQRGPPLHQNGGLGGWWHGGGGFRQRGGEKEAAAGEEVIVVFVGEEVAECADPAKKKELDGLRAEMSVALAECVNPMKFVLEAILEVFPVDKRGEKAGHDLGWACVLVLESLIPVVVDPVNGKSRLLVTPTVKEHATEITETWKSSLEEHGDVENVNVQDFCNRVIAFIQMFCWRKKFII